MSVFGGAQGPYPNPNNDYSIPQTINDGIQDLAWSPTSNVLVSGSWDNCVRCWEVQTSGTQFNAVPKAQITHDAPVLCTSFSGDGSIVFSGSCDKTAKMWALNGPAQGQQIAQHDAPIRCIRAIPEAQCVVTASWDKTVRYWDTRSPTPIGNVSIGERAYAMDIRYPLMVVATADRKVQVFDLRNPMQIHDTMQSNLKMQTRSIACFPDASGFAIGSIEGRVAIQHVDRNKRTSDFAFKCHRDGSNVYPVSSIMFHPFGTLATTGGDGTFCFWDKDARQKLKAFQKANQSISVGRFNARGDIFAYALSYDWSKGSEHYNPSQPSVIRLHNVAEAEIKQKPKANGRR